VCFNCYSFIETYFPQQLILLEILSADSISGKEFIHDADVVKLMVSIGVESDDVKNFETAVKILASIFNFDPASTDMFRVWLYFAASDEDSKVKIGSEISSALMNRNDAEFGQVVEKYSSVDLSETLLALIRWKVFKKKLKPFYFKALTGMVIFLFNRKILIGKTVIENSRCK